MGRVLEFVWFVAFLWFVISVFAAPILHTYWKARERRDAAATEQALKQCKADTTHAHEQDALL